MARYPAKKMKIKMNLVRKKQNQNQAKVGHKVAQALLIKVKPKLRANQLYLQKKNSKRLPPKACIRPVDGLRRNTVSF